ECRRAVAPESDHKINCFETGEHLEPVVETVYRSAGALDAPYARVVVHGDDEQIAQRSCLVEEFDVAAMHDVEAAVGEDDALARCAGAAGALEQLGDAVAALAIGLEDLQQLGLPATGRAI